MGSTLSKWIEGLDLAFDAGLFVTNLEILLNRITKLPGAKQTAELVKNHGKKIVEKSQYIENGRAFVVLALKDVWIGAVGVPGTPGYQAGYYLQRYPKFYELYQKFIVEKNLRAPNVQIGSVSMAHFPNENKLVEMVLKLSHVPNQVESNTPEEREKIVTQIRETLDWMEGSMQAGLMTDEAIYMMFKIMDHDPIRSAIKDMLSLAKAHMGNALTSNPVYAQVQQTIQMLDKSLDHLENESAKLAARTKAARIESERKLKEWQEKPAWKKLLWPF
ncbi:MAG: hypothetical protein A2445_02365 [Candidatus Jacksonbacteria bacterium RIFOXYC2_FULL_44_29]|nr:MAG: hypothetical protein UW45_C0047G0002 [Parcubacteria group bacterium GW2011_GWC2_44_22]OGY75501.1 MAG: hypothetical protein A2240_03240 [Candidatus Jacksonbacteria bacterium RIFOXYA2_FULL_43_12]OGY75837.1 MAG: hypothetical protein A2295_00190 [Candidatus Jacksonbacteria bacterium RIFOXYB2_FULL_44_15]OGY79086.1 MAG: hypothetical protein A2445_02365 [Candidatus Jacksonbacteria bacterium RIFOXYC2_FULL_44_29]OGY80266.1 MAG: hypothetical protein A2550_04010 [Candidatus Jacksonbacteria bacteri